MTCGSHAFVRYEEQSMTKCSIMWTHSTLDNRARRRRTARRRSLIVRTTCNLLSLIFTRKERENYRRATHPFCGTGGVSLPPRYRSPPPPVFFSFSLGGADLGHEARQRVRMYTNAYVEYMCAIPHAQSRTEGITMGRETERAEGWRGRRRRRWRWRRRRRRRRRRWRRQRRRRRRRNVAMLSHACAAWESEPRTVGSNEEAGVSALLAPEPRTSISRASLVVTSVDSSSRRVSCLCALARVHRGGWTRVRTDSRPPELCCPNRVLDRSTLGPASLRELPERNVKRPVSTTEPAVLTDSRVQCPPSPSKLACTRECGTDTAVFPCDRSTERSEYRAAHRLVRRADWLGRGDRFPAGVSQWRRWWWFKSVVQCSCAMVEATVRAIGIEDRRCTSQVGVRGCEERYPLNMCFREVSYIPRSLLSLSLYYLPPAINSRVPFGMRRSSPHHAQHL